MGIKTIPLSSLEENLRAMLSECMTQAKWSLWSCPTNDCLPSSRWNHRQTMGSPTSCYNPTPLFRHWWSSRRQARASRSPLHRGASRVGNRPCCSVPVRLLAG